MADRLKDYDPVELEYIARCEHVASALEAWAPHIASGYVCPAAAQTMLEAALLLSGRGK